MAVPTRHARREVICTRRGPVQIQTWCPAELLEALELAPDIGVFWKYAPGAPESQKQTLLRVAGLSDGNVVVARQAGGPVVGFILFAPPAPEEEWGCEPWLYELGAIEVARSWRGAGLARAMLAAALADPWFDRKLTLAVGLAWHWDLDGTGLDKYRYRDRLMRLFGAVGFEPCVTTHPEVNLDSANMLCIRAGRRLPPRIREGFIARQWDQSDTLFWLR